MVRTQKSQQEKQEMLLASIVTLLVSIPPPPLPRPDPLAGKTQKEICSDDVLLTLKYDWKMLREGGFSKICCAKDALGDEDRCMLDWPASDVPLCRDIDEWRNTLFALYGYTFKDAAIAKQFRAKPWYSPRADFDMKWVPDVVQKNAVHLKELVKKGGCVPDSGLVDESVASAETCKKAGVRWSLDLQKASKGHVDGMQQSDMAEAIAARCTAGWPNVVAQCLADGKGDPCLPALSAEQMNNIWSDLGAISEDVKRPN